MDQDIIEKINQDFSDRERKQAIKIITSIEHRHVMARSDYNLRNTRHAVLVLAKGNLKKLQDYSAAAKSDFRDVIMWAMQDQQEENKKN